MLVRGADRSFLVVLVLLALCLADLAQDKKPTTLRCELRASDHGGMWFSTDRPSHIHFLLFSNVDGLKVYQDWNSWGYYSRSFVATDSRSKSFEITRREGEWTKNFPSADTLNRREFLITDIYLCDGTWRVSPRLPAGRRLMLQIRGRFKNEVSKDEINTSVWTGEIGSQPVEAFFEKECVQRLNAGQRGVGSR